MDCKNCGTSIDLTKHYLESMSEGLINCDSCKSLYILKFKMFRHPFFILSFLSITFVFGFLYVLNLVPEQYKTIVHIFYYILLISSFKIFGKFLKIERQISIIKEVYDITSMKNKYSLIKFWFSMFRFAFPSLVWATFLGTIKNIDTFIEALDIFGICFLAGIVIVLFCTPLYFIELRKIKKYLN